jgi:hypothetical protein
MLEQCESTALEEAMQQSPVDGMAEHISESYEAPGDASDVAALAYRLWQERGCPEGSPQEDWFLAERELKRPAATGVEAEDRSAE